MGGINSVRWDVPSLEDFRQVDEALGTAYAVHFLSLSRGRLASYAQESKNEDKCVVEVFSNYMPDARIVKVLEEKGFVLIQANTLYDTYSKRTEARNIWTQQSDLQPEVLISLEGRSTIFETSPELGAGCEGRLSGGNFSLNLFGRRREGNVARETWVCNRTERLSFAAVYGGKLHYLGDHPYLGKEYKPPQGTYASLKEATDHIVEAFKADVVSCSEIKNATIKQPENVHVKDGDRTTDEKVSDSPKSSRELNSKSASEQ